MPICPSWAPGWCAGCLRGTPIRHTMTLMCLRYPFKMTHNWRLIVIRCRFHTPGCLPRNLSSQPAITGCQRRSLFPICCIARRINACRLQCSNVCSSWYQSLGSFSDGPCLCRGGAGLGLLVVASAQGRVPPMLPTPWRRRPAQSMPRLWRGQSS
jgi:hypothetical protein